MDETGMQSPAEQMPRPKPAVKMKHVAARMPESLVDRIDEYAAERAAALGTMDRTHAMMELLIAALDLAETQRKPPRK